MSPESPQCCPSPHPSPLCLHFEGLQDWPAWLNATEMPEEGRFHVGLVGKCTPCNTSDCPPKAAQPGKPESLKTTRVKEVPPECLQLLRMKPSILPPNPRWAFHASSMGSSDPPKAIQGDERSGLALTTWTEMTPQSKWLHQSPSSLLPTGLILNVFSTLCIGNALTSGKGRSGLQFNEWKRPPIYLSIAATPILWP